MMALERIGANLLYSDFIHVHDCQAAEGLPNDPTEATATLTLPSVAVRLKLRGHARAIARTARGERFAGEQCQWERKMTACVRQSRRRRREKVAPPARVGETRSAL